MPSVFIFADHVRKILESGKKEIQVPEGARISAAAYDLIREKKVRIVHVAAGQSTAVADEPQAAETPSVAEKIRAEQKSTGRDTSESEKVPESTIEISADILEDIVDRVIERFKHVKGRKSATPAAEVAPAIEPKVEESQDDDLVICRCEEITRGEIKDAIRNGMQTLNGVKRITRAGMGLCQGQTCQRLVAQIITEELGFAAADIDPTTARGPVRPLRLEVFANS